MKVLHIGKLLIPGGVERRKLSLFERLAAPEFLHRMVCAEIQDANFAERMRQHVISLDEIGHPDNVFALDRYRRVAQIVEEWRPDIIHGSIIDGYILASVVGRLKRVPVVIMEETSDPQNRRWKGHLLARAMAGLADHCIGVSPGVGRYLTETIRVPNSKVSVISNGVESPELPDSYTLERLRAKYAICEEDIVIGSVGRMEDESHKRFGDLIRAFSGLPRDPDLKLLLVGDGCERAGLERLSIELGVRERVVFAGFQFHTGYFYRLMDVFALVSEREAFGLVNAEAMRCGLPVVATSVGGIPDVVKDDETGFLVPPRNIEAITGGLRHLVECSEKRRQMGAAGKLRADLEFSAESYADRVCDLYHRLWKERKR